MEVVAINKSLSALGGSYVHKIDDITASDVFVIKDQIDGHNNNISILKEYSWSKDGDSWSPFFEIIRVPPVSQIDMSSKFSLKLRWTITQNLLEDTITIKKVSISCKKVKPCDVVIPESLPFIDQITTPSLQEIAVPSAESQIAMDYWYNKTYGVDIIYWNNKPDQDQIDTILNEYSIKKESARRCIKVVIENNVIPTDAIKFDEFAANFQQFQIRISKLLFEATFGKNEKPRDDDFIYLIVANRLYTVFSNHLERGINQVGTNYVLDLRTYEDDASVMKSEETEEWLEEKTLNHENMFGEANLDEMIDMLDVQQNNRKTINQDPVHDEVDRKSTIVTGDPYNNHGAETIQNYYDLSKVGTNKAAIVYKPMVSLCDEISFASWVKVQQQEFPLQHISVAAVQNGFKITTAFWIEASVGDYVVDGSSNKYYEVSSLEDDGLVIKGVNPSGNFGDLTLVKRQPMYFIQSDTNSPMSVDMFSNKRMRIRFLMVDVWYNIPAAVDNWHSLVINVSPKFKYVGVYWHKVRAQSDYSTSLELVSKTEKPVPYKIEFGESKAIIYGTNIKIANVRIYKSALGEDLIPQLQGVRFVPKPSSAYIIDDVNDIYNSFNVGRGALVRNNPGEKP